jgi:hypothetical protein
LLVCGGGYVGSAARGRKARLMHSGRHLLYPHTTLGRSVDLICM